MRFRRSYFEYIRPIFWLVVAGSLIGFLGTGVWRAQLTFREAELRAASAQAELEELRAREERLIHGIGRLGTEEGLEEEFRTRFNVARPDERVIVLVGESKDSAEALRKKENEASWWDTLVGWFKK